MFIPELNVGLSDYAVTRAIPELQCERHLITLDDIANHIGCSRSTVERAIATLRRAGRIRRVDGSRSRGYRYEITT